MPSERSENNSAASTLNHRPPHAPKRHTNSDIIASRLSLAAAVSPSPWSSRHSASATIGACCAASLASVEVYSIRAIRRYPGPLEGPLN